MSTGALVGIYFALVAAVALFAAGETALFALRWWKRRALKRDRRLAPLLARLESAPGRLLFALLIGSESAGIGAAMAADHLRERVAGGASAWGFAAAAAAAGLLTAMLGELLPKLAAASRPEPVARLLARPLRGWLTLASPVAGWFADERAGHEGREDLASVIATARAGGSLDPLEARLLTGLDSLARLPLSAVMTPHPDVAGVPLDADVSEAAEACVRAGFTRLAVFDEANDHWPGYLHAGDLLGGRERGGPLSPLVRPAPLIPESATVRQGLDALIRARAHLGFAVTETGQFAGLFTLEDGWRAALGESRRSARPAGERAWVCPGDLPVTDLPAQPPLEGLDPPPQTVGGLVAALSGEVPAAGQVIARNGWRFTVEAAAARRALRVRIEKPE